MFWQEDEALHDQAAATRVIDVSFRLNCRQLPVDHIYALSNSLRTALPWLDQEPLAAIHPIHVAGSQNGWFRPEHSPDEFILLSKRTRMILRLPQERISDAQQLTGCVLDVAGQRLEIGASQLKPLAKQDCLFARHLTCSPEQDEEQFLHQVADQLDTLGIRIRKALCGRSVWLHTPDGALHTRSLMLANLPADDAILLQQQGLGMHRLLGCGIFIPHKGIDAVGKRADDVAG